MNGTGLEIFIDRIFLMIILFENMTRYLLLPKYYRSLKKLRLLLIKELGRDEDGQNMFNVDK